MFGLNAAVFTNFFRRVSVVLIFTGAFASCTDRSGTTSNATADNQPAGDECKIDIEKMIKALPTICQRKIIAQLDFNTILKIYPRSDVHLQEIIEKRVTGYWPEWFLNQIKQEYRSKYREMLVVYYFGFFKLPSILVKQENLNRLLKMHTIASGLTEEFSTAFVGDHHLAYFNNRTGLIGIFDTISKKIVGETYVGINVGLNMKADIVRLGKSTFLLAMAQKTPSVTRPDAIIWEWNQSGIRKINQIMSLGLEDRFTDEQVFRVSDNSFATLRKSQRDYMFPRFYDTSAVVSTFDRWEIGSESPIETKSLNIGFNIVGRSYDLSPVTRYFQNIAKKGLVIDMDSLGIGTWGLGPKIDSGGTRMTIDPSRNHNIHLSDHDGSRIIDFMKPDIAALYKTGSGGSIKAIGKFGDVILHRWIPEGHFLEKPLEMFNIWTTLDLYIKEGLSGQPCAPRPS